MSWAAFATPRDGPPPLLVNESPSLPMGVYRRLGDDIRRGAIVAAPQPDRGRPYLAGLGMPAEVVLIKRVAAVGGDRVCVQGDRVVAGETVRTAHSRDSRGRRLPRWSGCRRLQEGELFLLGDTPGSFDSRYFGPVDRTAVTGVYREVFRW